MISLLELKSYMEAMPEKLPLIKTVNLVFSESDFSAMLRDKPLSEFPALVVVVPSADMEADNEDDFTENNTTLCYILSRPDESSMTYEDRLAQMIDAQNLIESFKKQIIADKGAHQGSHLMHYLDLSTFHTDPEYNLSGCYGWSLSFNINTNTLAI